MTSSAVNADVMSIAETRHPSLAGPVKENCAFHHRATPSSFPSHYFGLTEMYMKLSDSQHSPLFLYKVPACSPPPSPTGQTSNDSGFALAESRSGLSSVKYALFFPYKFGLDAVIWVNNCRRYLSCQLFYSLTEHWFSGQAGQYMPRRSDGAQLSENNTLGLTWAHFYWQNSLFVQEPCPFGIIQQMEVFRSTSL